MRAARADNSSNNTYRRFNEHDNYFSRNSTHERERERKGARGMEKGGAERERKRKEKEKERTSAISTPRSDSVSLRLCLMSEGALLASR